MISSSDEQVVIALRVAAHGIVVPPESRWVPERQSARDVWVIATLAVAIVALIAVVGALRGEPRTVPGSALHTVPPSESRATGASDPVTFDVSDDAGWLTARAMTAAEFVVLKPTWLPRNPDAASTCNVDVYRLGVVSSQEYHLQYGDGRPFGAPCTLTFGGHLDPAWIAGLGSSSPAPTATPVPVSTFAARGTVVYVKRFNETMYLQWVESGAFYEIIADGYELSDLIRALNSLEPVK